MQGEGDALGLKYKAKGLAAWATCTKASKVVALQQLRICRECPSATLGKRRGRLRLSCGVAGDEAGMQKIPPVCGCGVGLASKSDTAAIEKETEPASRRALALFAMKPYRKTKCLKLCPQGKH